MGVGTEPPTQDEFRTLAPSNGDVRSSPKDPAGRQTERSLFPLAVQLMLKLRLKAAGLPEILSAHSFRGLVVTDLLNHNVSLEDVQYLASEHHRPQWGFVKGGVPKRGKQI